jgi:hypothetical protein
MLVEMLDGVMTPEYAGVMTPQCECHFDCRDCYLSGEEWHLHGDEACPVHPDAVLTR